MEPVSELAYQRLRNEGVFDAETEQNRAIIFKKIRGWCKIRKLTAGRRRPRVRVVGLRRFLRKRARFFSRIKVSWGKALRRLKDGQAHMNDLFGGNYLFIMLANPLFHSNVVRDLHVGQHGNFPSIYSLGRMV